MAASDHTLETSAVKRNVRAEQIREFWHYFSENNGAVAGLVIVGILVLLAIFADLVAPHSPIEQFREHFLAPPVWLEGGSWAFVLATDAVGRDILSRLIPGVRSYLSLATNIL